MADIDQSANPAEAPEGRPAEETDAEVGDTYEPSTVEVDRGRVQGLGVGRKDLDYQRDPTGGPSAEQYARDPDDKGRVPDRDRREP